MTGNQSKKRYPAELKERAVKMTLDLQRGDPGDHGVINRVSRQLVSAVSHCATGSYALK
jgi:transposase-like protein